MISLELKRQRSTSSNVFEITSGFKLVEAAIDVGQTDPIISRDNVSCGVMLQMLRFHESDITEVHDPVAVLDGDLSFVR